MHVHNTRDLERIQHLFSSLPLGAWKILPLDVGVQDCHVLQTTQPQQV